MNSKRTNTEQFFQIEIYRENIKQEVILTKPQLHNDKDSYNLHKEPECTGAGRKEGRSHELGLGASVLAHFPAAALSRRKAEPKSTPLCI